MLHPENGTMLYNLQLDSLAELENILATVRQAGLTLHECSVEQASLEDVFVDIIAKAKT